ncbi:bifunctional biotin--[acetyl-CoA-carboxylase] ligase/biotin operon repressor BirA [Caviibacterium pharyngocola]|uniref:biotin--[biotin carboxyl-carrier protein] ligase n=1 Tax=Caviibacterium pharyngocola TaxID=28159 RepID=A0A2M8RWM7_9PAST|nr:bifunctional biotin--[acetyl-CoA-carboxylase] ligase/biotin operon repressor BirA [Caviibacterium pharyngocola]PJG83287.1 bifunctional biotin operon repressor/biotin--[acetyl-CoA-carboxylase] ligase [Caviibacterium pharyngocola]
MSDLLTILADGKTHSYEKLTALLPLERAEIERQIATLCAQGIFIKQNSHEVCLQPQSDLLNYVYLSEKLSPYSVEVKPVISSTNQYIIENIVHLEKGALCFAEYQSAGRGRRGRQWQSPFAGQVILSFYWTLEPQKSLNGLSSVIGIAIADFLKDVGVNVVGLKWPNDILLFGRKLAGILVEIINHKNGLTNLVVGVGMNLALPKQNHQIDQPWAELAEVLPNFDRNELTVRLVKKIYAYLAIFEEQGIAAFCQRWRESDYFFGEEVNIISEKETVSGIAQGIDEEGYLLLQTENGLCRFNGGEVSLRKKS